MTARCAVIDLIDGKVENIIIADLSDAAPDGCYLVELPFDCQAGIGWYWTGEQFVETRGV